MKIAFLNDPVYGYASGSSSATGGAERQQWLLARGMAAAGWTVTVGVRNGLQRGAETLIEGVRFRGIGCGQVFSDWRRFFAAERPDWWYWRCASHLFGFGVGLAKLSGARTIFAAGLDRDVRVREALYTRPRWWPAYAMGLSRTDRILLQHGGQYAELPDRWKTKASIVPSIAAGLLTPKPHADRPRQVAWIAALREPKRPDRLVEIAHLLPNVQFVVCGGITTYMASPGYGERIVQMFRSTPNIDYRSQVSPDEAVRIIGDSAMLLSTSDEEGFPSTFLEAWAQGTPVVSLHIDPDNVIRTSGLGAVCGGVEGAAVEIGDLLMHLRRREEIARRAVRHATEAHSPEAVVRLVERALESPSPASAGRRAQPSVDCIK